MAQPGGQRDREHERERLRAFREKNRLAWNRYHREYQAQVRADPSRYQRKLDYHKAYYRAHREEMIASQRARYRARFATDADAIRRVLREYRARHPEKTRLLGRMANQRRRSRLGAEFLTAAQWWAILDAHEHRCADCRCEVPLEIEHKVPLARGGTHAPENITAACRPCNLRKGTKTEEEFRKWLADELGVSGACPFHREAADLDGDKE